jgi:hypothetical protein
MLINCTENIIKSVSKVATLLQLKNVIKLTKDTHTAADD